MCDCGKRDTPKFFLYGPELDRLRFLKFIEAASPIKTHKEPLG